MISDKLQNRKYTEESFLLVQWLGLGAFTAVAPGSISGWENKILRAVQRDQKKKKKKKRVQRISSLQSSNDHFNLMNLAL